jgi:hypothetical protein
MADTIVLTIHAKKVTMREKNGSRSSTCSSHNPGESESPFSNERLFFSKMRVIAGDHQIASSLTDASFSTKPVYLTFTRTEFTRFED